MTEEVRELDEIQMWRGQDVEVDYTYFPGEPATDECPIAEPDAVELVAVRVLVTADEVLMKLSKEEEAEFRRECLAEARRLEELKAAFRR